MAVRVVRQSHSFLLDIVGGTLPPFARRPSAAATSTRGGQPAIPAHPVAAGCISHQWVARCSLFSTSNLSGLYSTITYSAITGIISHALISAFGRQRASAPACPFAASGMTAQPPAWPASLHPTASLQSGFGGNQPASIRPHSTRKASAGAETSGLGPASASSALIEINFVLSAPLVRGSACQMPGKDSCLQ